ncbi:hypothetical protein [Desulfoplanes sp.]
MYTTIFIFCVLGLGLIYSVFFRNMHCRGPLIPDARFKRLKAEEYSRYRQGSKTSAEHCAYAQGSCHA